MKNRLILIYIISIAISLSLVITTDEYLYFTIPIIPIFIQFITKLKISLVFSFLLFCTPLSIDVDIFNGSRISLFSEPILIVLLVLIPFISKLGNKKIHYNYKNPVIFIISLQFLLFIASILYSVDTIKSTKYLLTKIWFIIPIFYYNYAFNKTPSDAIKSIMLYTSGTLIVLIYTTINHAFLGFSFEDVSYATPPFNHNHVNYSTLIAIILPYIFLINKVETNTNWILFFKKYQKQVFLLFVFAIVISFTRASWLAVFLMFIFYIIFKLKLTRQIINLSVIGLLFLCFFAIKDNNYIDYAPDYETTIFNKGDINGHLQATYEMKDVSGMERVYRWVSVINMFQEKPILGFGTNTFYPTYKEYTNYKFKTYVSDNPEKSTTHNYFLLLIAEQGLIGLLLFICLLIYFLCKSQDLYYKTNNTNIQFILLTNYLSVITLIIHLLLNDLIEVDKFAILFFFQLALLISCERWINHLNSEGEIIET